MADLERLGEGLGAELSRFGAPAGLAPVVAVWPAAVGEMIARNAWPQRVARDGTLHVATSSAAWGFELTHLAGDILAKLQAALGAAAPAALRFAPGKLPAQGADPAALAPRPLLRATPEEVAAADELAAAIGDPELRAIVARAARASLSRSRGDRDL